MICANARDQIGPTLSRWGRCPSKRQLPSLQVAIMFFQMTTSSQILHTINVLTVINVTLWPYLQNRLCKCTQAVGLVSLVRKAFIQASSLLTDFSLRIFIARCPDTTQGPSPDLPYHRHLLLAVQASCCTCHTQPTSQRYPATIRRT